MHQFGVMWCIKKGNVRRPVTRKEARHSTSKKSNRISITLSGDVYEELEKRASRQDVSIAWRVREAVNHYLADGAPPFATQRDDLRRTK
jgi:hypothetical protein